MAHQPQRTVQILHVHVAALQVAFAAAGVERVSSVQDTVVVVSNQLTRLEFELEVVARISQQGPQRRHRLVHGRHDFFGYFQTRTQPIVEAHANELSLAVQGQHGRTGADVAAGIVKTKLNQLLTQQSESLRILAPQIFGHPKAVGEEGFAPSDTALEATEHLHIRWKTPVHQIVVQLQTQRCVGHRIWVGHGDDVVVVAKVGLTHRAHPAGHVQQFSRDRGHALQQDHAMGFDRANPAAQAL